jgi:TRAP-type C4-dicarboxylate transport system permease large subunit
MVTIYLGVATATEAAAVGAATSMLMVLRRRGNRFQTMMRGLIDTGVATSSIFILIIGAGMFGLALATTQIPQNMAAFVATLQLPNWALTFILILPYLVLGCFIDGISMLLLTLPVVFPIVQQSGINPVLFGILVTKTTEIGAITPPVGLNVFVVKNTVPELKLGEAFKGSFPFVVLEILLIALLIAFPGIVTSVLP